MESDKGASSTPMMKKRETVGGKREGDRISEQQEHDQRQRT